MFAPTLFIGAMLGTAIGSLQQQLLPHMAGAAGFGPIGSYTLAGMGVLFAAFLRAPLTSVFLVLEVSGNYSILVPVILANTIGYLLARKFDPEPIFEVFTIQDGLHLPSMEEVREEERLHIEDALAMAATLPQIPVFPASLQYVEALRAATTAPSDGGAVVVQFADGSCYALTVRELEALGAEASLETAVGALIPAERMPVLYQDMTLDATLPFFGRWPALAVRNRARVMKIEGVLTETLVLACYQRVE
jgi:CIC family chloride channel protein